MSWSSINKSTRSYEASAIVEKFERKNEFPLVFFKNIKGSKIPLVINLGATYERLALSLGSPSVPQMVKDLAHREHNPVPVKEISARDAPCKEVILKGDAADLDLLPVLTLNEGDAGAYVNAAAMICKERGTGAVNVGIYRHQKQGKRQLGLMVNPANHANYVRAEYEDHNEPMEVALAIGHHPALNMAAVSKQAGVGSELEIAGAFLGEPLGSRQGRDGELDGAGPRRDHYRRYRAAEKAPLRRPLRRMAALLLQRRRAALHRSHGDHDAEESDLSMHS